MLQFRGLTYTVIDLLMPETQSIKCLRFAKVQSRHKGCIRVFDENLFKITRIECKRAIK